MTEAQGVQVVTALADLAARVEGLGLLLGASVVVLGALLSMLGVVVFQLWARPR